MLMNNCCAKVQIFKINATLSALSIPQVILKTLGQQFPMDELKLENNTARMIPYSRYFNKDLMAYIS